MNGCGILKSVIPNPLNKPHKNLTAVLTKALQEAIAKIETLETKVKALEEA